MEKKITQKQHKEAVVKFSGMKTTGVLIGTPAWIRSVVRKHGTRTVSEFLFFNRQAGTI